MVTIAHPPLILVVVVVVLVLHGRRLPRQEASRAQLKTMEKEGCRVAIVVVIGVLYGKK